MTLVQIEPKAIKIWTTDIKRITIRPNGTEKQIRPAWWTPDPSRTIFYYDFEDSSNRLADTSWNGNNATSASGIAYEQVWWQYVATLSSGGGTITINWLYGASIGTWDFTVSFWHYPVQPSSYNYPMMFGMSSNNSPYPWPNIFFDPHNRNGLWNKVIFRITGAAQKASTTSASSLYNGWHHIVMTRNSWVITCYIDANSEVSWTDGTTSFPTSWSNLWVLISRWVWSSQDFPAWAKWDKFILEKVWWSAADVTNYYNQTKWIYWL